MNTHTNTHTHTHTGAGGGLRRHADPHGADHGRWRRGETDTRVTDTRMHTRDIHRHQGQNTEIHAHTHPAPTHAHTYTHIHTDTHRHTHTYTRTVPQIVMAGRRKFFYYYDLHKGEAVKV